MRSVAGVDATYPVSGDPRISGRGVTPGRALRVGRRRFRGWWSALRAALGRVRLPRARVRRWILGAGVGLGVVLGATAFAGWVMARQAPAWWRTVRADDPRTVEAARRLQDAIATQLHRIRGIGEDGTGEVWAVSLKAADANAWLNAQLPKWLAHEHEEFDWPRELAELQVDFSDGLVRVGALVRMAGQERIFSATIRPTLEKGSLWMPASWVRVGRLSVPAGWILGHARRERDEFIPEEVRDLPETLAMFDAFAGRVPVAQDAVVRLGDGRQVRLLKIRARDGRLEITCRTEVGRTARGG
jgi:hypothetical protein